jgi:hypothetical protein
MYQLLESLLLYPLALVVIVLGTAAPLFVAYFAYSVRRDMTRIADALEKWIDAAPNPQTRHTPKLSRAAAAESSGGPISQFGRL